MKKRSFFERLTGSVNIDEDEFDQGTEEMEDSRDTREVSSGRGSRNIKTIERDDDNHSTWMEEQAGEGELSVDVYQTPNDVIVKAMIPGVRKDEMDIALSRDSVTIKGSRAEDRTITEDNYMVRELDLGAFSRTVRLPHEVDIEHAEATESQGVLTIKLPRIDKDRQAKLRIKSI